MNESIKATNEPIKSYAVIGGRVAVPLTEDNYLALNMFREAFPVTYGGRDYRYANNPTHYDSLVEVVPARVIDLRTPAQREEAPE